MPSKLVVLRLLAQNQSGHRPRLAISLSLILGVYPAPLPSRSLQPPPPLSQPDEDKRDLIERLFPCIFRGLKEADKEPPMYADCRLVVIPGLPQRGASHGQCAPLRALRARVQASVRLFQWLSASCRRHLRLSPTQPPASTPPIYPLPPTDGISNTDLAYEWLDNAVYSRGHELARLGGAWVTDGPTRECVVEFMAYEPSLFSLDMPDTLSRVYTHKLAAGVLEEDAMLEVSFWQNMNAVA